MYEEAEKVLPSELWVAVVTQDGGMISPAEAWVLMDLASVPYAEAH